MSTPPAAATTSSASQVQDLPCCRLISSPIPARPSLPRSAHGSLFAYLEHKAELGVPIADAEIVHRVDEITILLIHGTGMAIRTNDTHWLERYQWFAEIVDEFIEQMGRVSHSTGDQAISIRPGP